MISDGLAKAHTQRQHVECCAACGRVGCCARCARAAAMQVACSAIALVPGTSLPGAQPRSPSPPTCLRNGSRWNGRATPASWERNSKSYAAWGDRNWGTDDAPRTIGTTCAYHTIATYTCTATAHPTAHHAQQSPYAVEVGSVLHALNVDWCGAMLHSQLPLTVNN